MEQKIDYRFKILYAVAIIMVVSGHSGGGVSLADNWFPCYGYQIALFIFASGYFYKKSSEENMGNFILKKVKQLVIPLYVYTIIYGCIAQVLRRYGFSMGDDLTFRNTFLRPILDGHQFVYNLSAWFVVPLFMVQVFNVLVRKVLGRLELPEWVYFILFTGLGLAGNLLACRGYYEGWWLVLDRMLYFLIFYELGIFYRRVLEKYDRRIPGIWYFAFLFAVQLAIAFTCGRIPVYTPSWCYDFTDGPLMPALVGYTGIAFWLRIATILEPVLGRNKYVNLIADNTFSIMMNHLMVFMLIKTAYGCFSLITPFFHDFDWVMYKTKFWWMYLPRGVEQTLILNTIAGIVLPVLLQLLIDRMCIWGQRLFRAQADC